MDVEPPWASQIDSFNDICSNMGIMKTLQG